MNVATSLTAYDFDEIDRISREDLASIVIKIDEERIYPEDIMRAYGKAGAYSTHGGGIDGNVDLTDAILAMARASEECLSTGFCVWCQDTLAWYIASSDSDVLKAEVLPKVLKGDALGGTGMSNPMKAMGQIEPMRLKGVRVDGGYKVKGMLPWVSNLVEDGYFGSMFHVDVEGEDAPKRVMAIFHAAWDGIKLKLDHEFVAMGGTATCNVQCRDVFVPDAYVLGDPAGDFIQRIRPGFTLLQCGMAAGIVKNCIELIEQVEAPLGHVNKYLEVQASDLRAEYDALVTDVLEMAKTPYDLSDAFYLRVLKARLAGGELSMKAAHWAQLHMGARGYVTRGAAQRRLREAYFVGIVTPATKHLRMLIDQMETA
ncbi:acyl-CoA dehydrogenase family protein [Mesobacterium sp. TK19101]|uniref:Acyl-CoA dehydrogenase family protein n=1 Tax=Mesobacterium hydrothermale TaxID=3111907 RepID=A0ABU6HKQ9_9RHOB|nr:acyl-CoA dehydrogenase family protein [Mesobacterium sp. TK19101]MEC3862435.1 acyl-CoA dehydrogenase family protein [Mesobacterium sp. TK19101]